MTNLGCMKVTQWCPTPWNPINYTDHGILQVWILECIAFPFSRGSSQPREWTQVSSIASIFFTSWTTREALTNLDSILKSKDITLQTKVCLVKAMVFPVVMYGCESWTIKKAECWRTVVLEGTLESPLDCKEIQPVHPKGNQSRIFIGKSHAEAETPILWPPDAKNWLTGKDPDAGKDWRWEEKGTTEDETVGWHHRLDGHRFEQASGVGDGQGSLACCSL